jgi:hypothetical protein
VVVAVVQDRRLKLALLAGLVVVVLVIVVLVGRGILHQQAHHKETTGLQVQQIKAVVVVEQMLPDRLTAMVEMERQAVFLEHPLLTAVAVAVGLALLKPLLVLAVRVVAVQGQVVLPHQQRGL